MQGSQDGCGGRTYRLGDSPLRFSIPLPACYNNAAVLLRAPAIDPLQDEKRRSDVRGFVRVLGKVDALVIKVREAEEA